MITSTKKLLQLIAAGEAGAGALSSDELAAIKADATAVATPSKLMIRDAEGRAKVVAPAVAGDIALKSTVTADVDAHKVINVSVHGVSASGFEDKANKNVASGYCPLDAGVLTPLANIPATLTGKDADTVDTKHFTDVQADAQAKVNTHSAVTTSVHGIANTSLIVYKLATVAGIDGKTVAITNLYTVPAGKIAIITGAVIRVTVADTITVVPTLGIGIAAGEDDIFASVALTGLNATTKVYKFTASATYRAGAVAEVIKLGIDTGATATTMTIAVDLLGYLL